MTSSASARRTLLGGLVALTTFTATALLHQQLRVSGLTTFEVSLMVAFVLTFGWVALSFWSAVLGFWALRTGRSVPSLRWPEPNVALQGRTAIVMPIYNEDSRRVFANLQAMVESLARTGQQNSFDWFVLSDSQDPDACVAEQLAWSALCDRTRGQGRIYYRRRLRNEAKKSGNLADFCRRWGARYEHMIVLDADSLMEGETLVTMAGLMQANPQAGIIQAPPVAVNRGTLFARLQQFAGRVAGPLVAAGSSYWHQGESNYWGHNAILRVSAFMAHCGLPTLPGKHPFGGHILSHDFVEAALIRRGGWQVWLVPQLTGSYEELPPTLLDYAKRDRRWCQGNLQHMGLITARGLHPLSRLHLAMGALSYLASPLWLGFLLAGMLVALEARLVPPSYFPDHKTLFPTWPVYDTTTLLGLFVFAMVMLWAPKVLGTVALSWRRDEYQAAGATRGLAQSLLLEAAFSMLIAPIMMIFHTSFVFSTLAGSRSGWGTQRRDDAGIGWREALEAHWRHVAIGVLLGMAAYQISPVLLWWLSPVVAGLCLSVPLSYVLASRWLGRAAFRMNLFRIPEETNPPEVLRRANELFEQADEAATWGRVLTDPRANALHLALLSAEVSWNSVPVDERLAQQAAARLLQGQAPDRLERTEKLALLLSPQVLVELHLWMLDPAEKRLAA